MRISRRGLFFVGYLFGMAATLVAVAPPGWWR